MTAPADIDGDLVAKARELAEEQGDIPSIRALKPHLQVGNDKAKAVRELLLAEQPDDPEPQAGPPVPEPEHTQAHPVVTVPAAPRSVPTWPVLVFGIPAFVAIWTGWVEMGRLTGFGVVHPLPGIWDAARLDTAITLPIGMETYAAYALWVWLSGRAPVRAQRFAKRSAGVAMTVAASGMVAYHLMAAAGMTAAPWWITTVVACLPVAVLGMGAALAHMVKAQEAL